MQSKCNSIKPDASFQCFSAEDFTNFAVLAQQSVDQNMAKRERELAEKHAQMQSTQQQHQQNQEETRGILIVIYPKLLPSVYATVRALRARNCTLPIELWFHPFETKPINPIVDAILDQFGPASLHPIQHVYATSFNAKIFSILHTKLDHILFLDADNVPVQDPSYLFDSDEYKATGTLFWPDFWHPEHTIFNVHQDSLLWPLLDSEFVPMFEQESGQLVINRKTSARALEMLWFYGFHRPNHLHRMQLVHGDKDLFRLAWLKTGTPFHMMIKPPAIAGQVRHGVFCGATMVQHDANGAIVFLHRNARKLQGNEQPEDRIWFFVQSWRNIVPVSQYQIQIYDGTPAFNKELMCYGHREADNDLFDLVAFEFGAMEEEIFAYAHESATLQW